MTDNYDVILVGAGHNGLVCATYLAKAGRKVLVLEARDLRRLLRASPEIRASIERVADQRLGRAPATDDRALADRDPGEP